MKTRPGGESWQRMRTQGKRQSLSVQDGRLGVRIIVRIIVAEKESEVPMTCGSYRIEGTGKGGNLHLELAR